MSGFWRIGCPDSAMRAVPPTRGIPVIWVLKSVLGRIDRLHGTSPASVCRVEQQTHEKGSRIWN